VGSKWGGESTRSMARWPSIMCAMYFAAVGPLFLWPPVAFFPPLPLAFVTRSSTSAASASSGFKSLLLLSLRLLLLGFVPWWLHLTGCWSTFNACHLRESAVAFVGALDCGLGGMGGVAVVVVNEMVVGGRKMFDVATQTTVSGTCRATWPYRVLICTLY